MAKKFILKGKKVVLRPLSLDDAPRFCQWLKDREVTKYLSIYDQAPPTLKEEREWIRETNRNKRNLVLAIDTIEGVHVGVVSLRVPKNTVGIAEYGISIGDKKYWGQGCGTEAGKLIVDYGFKKLKLHRIHLNFIAYNFRGQKSYEKIGFKQEGIFRQHIYREGYWHDQIHMGLLREEYLNKINHKKYGRKITKN
ncbi:MAG: GNAT family N-acetyltransferase [Candidatus Buchananbacteria bacterium]|nr:GNAT family N-acetyltransferase [Candidatus Buchananbacteria bacterium]